MDLQRRLSERDGEFLLFAVTPPRRSTSPERAQQIAEATLESLRPLVLDDLVLRGRVESPVDQGGPVTLRTHGPGWLGGFPEVLVVGEAFEAGPEGVLPIVAAEHLRRP